MARRWTGPGCTEANGYRAVGKTAAGIVEWERIDEVSAVDKGAAPGAEILITKSQTAEEPKDMNLTDTITKALEPDAGDTDQERQRKAVVKMALESGATTVEKVAAETALEGIAKAAQRADPAKSFEQHYVAAMTAHPDLVRLLD